MHQRSTNFKRRAVLMAAVLAVLSAAALTMSPTGASVSNDAAASRPRQVPEPYREKFELIDVTEPEPLEDAELRHVVDLRRAFGLAADPAVVKQMHEDPVRFSAVRSSTGMFGYLLVTPSELDDLNIRAEIEWQTQSVTKSVEDALGDAYAGLFFEGTELVVQCVGCGTASAAEQIGLSSFPQPLKEHTEIRAVKYSLKYLNELESRVADYLRDTEVATNGLGVFIMSNRIEVNSNPQSPKDLERSLAEQFGSEPVVVVPESGVTRPFVDKDDDLIYGIVEGGQAIIGDGMSEPCTSGFAVQGGFGPFMLTAGHCFQNYYFPPFYNYGPNW